MNVLFIYPNKVMSSRMPHGIGYLASYLKKEGHQVRVFDTTFMKCGDMMSDEELRSSSLQVRNPDFEKYDLVEKKVDLNEELVKEIEFFKPDIVGLSVVDPNYQFGLELLAGIKGRYPQLLNIVGGPTATFEPEEVINEDCVDMVCVGEGEEAFTELCSKIQDGEDITNIKNIWIKKDGRIFKNDVRPFIDVNTLLYPDWEIFDQRHLLRPMAGRIYRMGLIPMTRGCLFNCNYCSNKAMGKIYNAKGKWYRYKHVGIFIKELKYFKEKYDLNFIYISDDLFPLHKDDILDDFCEQYKKEVGLPFSVSLHPELIKEEQFAKIVDAGCCNICVGLESGNPMIRKKTLGRIYNNEQVVQVFKLARKYEIRSSSFNMIGIPFETRKEIFDTIELNRRSNPTTTTLTFFHPYRGTTLRSLCIKEKLLDPQREKEYENVYRAESCLKLPQIEDTELRGLFRTFQLYFRLPKILYFFIQIAERESMMGDFLFNFLKAMFYRITDKEAVWDFSKFYTPPREIDNRNTNTR